MNDLCGSVVNVLLKCRQQIPKCVKKQDHYFRCARIILYNCCCCVVGQMLSSDKKNKIMYVYAYNNTYIMYSILTARASDDNYYENCRKTEQLFFFAHNTYFNPLTYSYKKFEYYT